MLKETMSLKAMVEPRIMKDRRMEVSVVARME